MELNRVILGDSSVVLKTLPDASIDSVVTDPPAGIAMMGADWDTYGRPEFVAFLQGIMAECFRVLRPGGHLISWSIPRTSHWTATAIENSGFEIVDCFYHIFGSGFPKSLNIGKAIDKMGRTPSHLDEIRDFLVEARRTAGMSIREINVAFGFSPDGNAGHWFSYNVQTRLPTKDQWFKLKELLKFGDDYDDVFLSCRTPHDRPVLGTKQSSKGLSEWRKRYTDPDFVPAPDYMRSITSAGTPESVRWEGWGTSLKPAVETWWLARKPVAV